MLKAFLSTLILLLFFQISNAQNGKILGHPEFEIAEDLLQSKKYTAWLSVLEMAVVKNHPEAIIRKGDN